jgi:hypothetical protein
MPGLILLKHSMGYLAKEKDGLMAAILHFRKLKTHFIVTMPNSNIKWHKITVIRHNKILIAY